MRTPKLSEIGCGILPVLAALSVVLGTGGRDTAEAQAYPCDPPPVPGTPAGTAVGPFTHANTTGVTASDLCVVYTGTGGSLNSLAIVANAPGCPAPATANAGSNLVFIDWDVACVDHGETVTVSFNSLHGPVETNEVIWTLAGVPITPSPTPTPPPGGGIAQPIVLGADSAADTSGSSSASDYTTPIAAAAGIAAVLALAAGGWYARRRWLR